MPYQCALADCRIVFYRLADPFQEFLYLLGRRFNQQFPIIFTDVHTQKVESITDVCDSRLFW